MQGQHDAVIGFSKSLLHNTSYYKRKKMCVYFFFFNFEDTDHLPSEFTGDELNETLSLIRRPLSHYLDMKSASRRRN